MGRAEDGEVGKRGRMQRLGFWVENTANRSPQRPELFPALSLLKWSHWVPVQGNLLNLFLFCIRKNPSFLQLNYLSLNRSALDIELG